MHLRPSVCRLSVLAVVAMMSSLARADVGPAPSCPTGLRSAYLMGRYCAPVACRSDSECEGDSTCAQRAYCVRERDSSQPDALQWAGSCEGDQACSGDERCVRASFCGPRVESAASETPAQTSEPTASAQPVSETPGRRRGCDVLAAGASGASSGLVVAASIVALVIARRRRH